MILLNRTPTSINERLLQITLTFPLTLTIYFKMFELINYSNFLLNLCISNLFDIFHDKKRKTRLA